MSLGLFLIILRIKLSTLVKDHAFPILKYIGVCATVSYMTPATERLNMVLAVFSIQLVADIIKYFGEHSCLVSYHAYSMLNYIGLCAVVYYMTPETERLDMVLAVFSIQVAADILQSIGECSSTVMDHTYSVLKYFGVCGTVCYMTPETERLDMVLAVFSVQVVADIIKYFGICFRMVNHCWAVCSVLRYIGVCGTVYYMAPETERLNTVLAVFSTQILADAITHTLGECSDLMFVCIFSIIKYIGMCAAVYYMTPEIERLNRVLAVFSTQVLADIVQGLGICYTVMDWPFLIIKYFGVCATVYYTTPETERLNMVLAVFSTQAVADILKYLELHTYSVKYFGVCATVYYMTPETDRLMMVLAVFFIQVGVDIIQSFGECSSMMNGHAYLVLEYIGVCATVCCMTPETERLNKVLAVISIQVVADIIKYLGTCSITVIGRAYSVIKYIGVCATVCYMPQEAEKLYLVLAVFSIQLGVDIIQYIGRKPAAAPTQEIYWPREQEIYWPREDWLNKLVWCLWPTVRSHLYDVCKYSLEPDLHTSLSNSNAQGFTIEDVHLGTTPPRFTVTHVERDSSNRIIMSINVMYDGECRFTCSHSIGSVGVESIKVNGKLRVVAGPIMKQMPMINSLEVCFVEEPKFDCTFTRWLGAVTNLSFIKSIIFSRVAQHLKTAMVYPNYYEVPLLADKAVTSWMYTPRGRVSRRDW